MPQIVLANGERKILKRVMIALGCAALLVAGLVLMLLNNKLSYDAMNKQVAKLGSEHDYRNEMTVLKTYINTKPPASYRYPALIKLGDVSSQQHDFHTAFVAYEQARALTTKPDEHLELGIAESATGLRDTDTAIAAYNELIKMTPAKDYLKVGEYEDDIRGLEKGR